MDLHWIPPASRFALQNDRAASPSPSRSPHRRQTPAPSSRLVDPLLSNLSPSSTLDALQTSPTGLPPQDVLHKSIAAASLSERAFAVRAATAAKRLKEWYEEVQQWQWLSHPFETPMPTTSPGRGDGSGTVQESWGSLPAQTVLGHENRIDDIREAMEELGLNELKMHVRDAHLSATSHSMDDFTAIMTTTVMQALPVIFRLEALLGVWDARLAILRASPGFANTMDQTQQEMMAAWRMLDNPHNDSTAHDVTKAVHRIKSNLEGRIRELGQRLDYMLDTLEGHQDTVPDRWIDDMEQLETEFGNWVVEAQKYTVDVELMSQEALESQHQHVKTSKGISLNPPDQPHQNPEEVASATHSIGQHIAVSMPCSQFTQEPGISPMANGTMDGANDGLPYTGHRPLPLDLHQHRRNHSKAISDISNISYPGSATSDYFSDMPSPQIQDASRAEYFGVGSPIEVTTPGLPRRESRISEDTEISRDSSQRTERGDPSSQSRASPVIAEPTIDENGISTDATTNELQDVDTTMITGVKVSNTTPAIPEKPRHRFEEVAHLSPNSTPVNIFRRKTAAEAQSTPNRVATVSPTKSTGAELEARISSILTDIPANIRLARSSNNNATAIAPALVDLDSKTARKTPRPRLMRAQTAAPSPPSMTLTPTAPKVARTQNGESEIQLYHLHQSDKGPPIKLFIRLVGEGERVMVRIGGGWADLAEYLKEYAIHHGQRTVNGGQFDIQGFPQSQSSSPVTTFDGVPTGSPDGFRPTSRDSNASSRHSWTGDESPSLGLAGPKSRKAAVSPNKQAWVDTMIEKARYGTSEKKKGARDAFGDMGIIGGTKRLFMKKGG
ncbi:MAG: hypothetical protein Q9166_005319 [cf. Caloplaca sp. 2 TL-2023]